MPAESLRSRVLLLASLLRTYYPGWETEVFDELDSTSSEARRRVESGSAARPFLIIALHQTAGRGRQDRRWLAPPGSALLFTAAIPMNLLGARDAAFGKAQPDFPLTLWPLQSALALGLRLRMLGWRAELKWPNDILVGGRKVAGVLCEVCRGWLLVGVGVNLTQTEEQLATVGDVRVPPGSLATQRPRHRYRLAPPQAAISLVQGIIAVLESPWPREQMLRYYRDWCTTLGTKVATTDTSGEAVEGVAAWVNDDGSLNIELPGGRIVRSVNEVTEV